MRILSCLFTLLAVLLSGCAATQAPSENKELKVLMIGNSFSQSAEYYLPQIAASVPGCKLKFSSLYIGGCTFQRHWQNVEKSAADPNYKPYLVHTRYSYKDEPKDFYASVNELISAEPWDIVTIQQGSPHSFKYELYQPYADNLIKYIQKNAPQAEILIQQTWSYRIDSPRFARLKTDQKSMYAGLDAAYKRLAREHKFRVIPTGYAVELYRRYTPDKIQWITPEMVKNVKYPATLSSAGDVVGYPRWLNPENPQKRRFANDSIHLNPHGRYMQSCIWFASLFQRPVADIKYAPEGFDTQEVKLLKKCADEAIKTYPQAK